MGKWRSLSPFPYQGKGKKSQPFPPEGKKPLARKFRSCNGRKCTDSFLSTCRPDDRGLLARGGTDVLAHSRAENRLRPRRPAVGLHGYSDLAAVAHASRSCRGPAGVCSTAAYDAHGTAPPVRASRGCRRPAPLAAYLPT